MLPNPKQKASSIYTSIERNKTIYKLEERGKGRGRTNTLDKTRGLQGLKMTLKEEAKAGRDRRTRSRDTVVDSLTVNNPYSMECHRVTGLETVTKLTS